MLLANLMNRASRHGPKSVGWKYDFIDIKRVAAHMRAEVETLGKL